MSQFSIIKFGSAGEMAGVNMAPPPEMPMGCQARRLGRRVGREESAEQAKPERKALQIRRKGHGFHVSFILAFHLREIRPAAASLRKRDETAWFQS